MIKYQGHSITFQEVPGEISLALQIANCPHHCDGCHTPQLREDVGRPLANDILGLIARYGKMITCVCLMGEGNDVKALSWFLRVVKAFGLKTCLYSGRDQIGELATLVPFLDYLKLGPYRQDKGGLASTGTNQRFYAVDNGKLNDITHKFQEKRGAL